MSSGETSRLVERVAESELDELRAIWGQRYGAAPTIRSIPILRMMLAWRVQAEAHGGLDPATLKLLARSGAVEPEGKHLGIGARLCRTWKGKKIEVIVEKDGFRWDDQLYPSLSAAATAIAGSRWNGPRFFGLRDPT